MVNRVDYVELGLACAEACKVLARGTEGRQAGQLSQAVLDAIEQLMTWVGPRDVYAGRSTHHALNRRTVTEIQRKIIKRGKRNVVSRLFHVNDEEAIATWRLGINRITHVFNVRPATSVWPSLTFRSQTDFGTNTHVIVPANHRDTATTHTIASDVRRDTPNADTTVPDIRHEVSKSHAIVSDVHRNALRSREDANQAVSTSCTLPVIE